jgi:hypothetical protein
VDEQRWIRVLLALSAAEGQASSKLCTMSAGVVAVSGAGVTVLGDRRSGPMTVCSSDRVARTVEDLQFTLGEGPCIDAYELNHPVSEPDLADPSTMRWPRFTPPAVEAGAAAVFGFPLRVDGTRVGALNLYRDRPGELSAHQHADALVVADVVAREILAMQAGGDGAGPVGDPGLRLVGHQATGMIAAQLGIGVDEALVRLRARAYADGVLVTVTATAVVDRRMRFHEADP